LVSGVERPSDSADAPPPRDGIGRGRVRRSAPLVGLAARSAGEAAMAGLRGKRAATNRAALHARSAERYAELLGRSKGALMKVGQILSTVSAGAAVPAEFQLAYQTALARLRDDAPPMARELAKTVLDRELGRASATAFAEFDWEPLAAASIGQVHAARLRDGRAVAVKIQYPGVGDAIRADLKNTELLATFLSVIGGVSSRPLSLDIRGAAREMGARIAEELDYRLEAANQAEFAERYRGHPFIHVPEVIAELSTARVLTQELCLGRSWSEAVDAEPQLRDRWAEAIWRFVYGSHNRLCMTNVDLHPGNYLFHDDGSVSFLDFGCVKRYRRDQVELMTDIVRECIRGDVLGTWRTCVEAGFWSSRDPVSPEDVFVWWHEPFRYVWAEQPFTVTPEYAASWIERRFSPSGPSANALRYTTMSPEYCAWPRIEVALASVLGQLHATNDWKTIWAEYSESAQPLTTMGRLDHAYFEEREAAGCA
jgi:predicted unusual protein kinase regulating ubiquinone biosynthesis (AarF/ABC1/UbiB family)